MHTDVGNSFRILGNDTQSFAIVDSKTVRMLHTPVILALFCLFARVSPQPSLLKRRCVFQVTRKNISSYTAAGNVSGSLQLCENTRCCEAIYQMRNGQPQVDTLACSKVDTSCPDATCKVERIIKNRFIRCLCSTDLCNSNITWTVQSEERPHARISSEAETWKIVVVILLPILGFLFIGAKWIYLWIKKGKTLNQAEEKNLPSEARDCNKQSACSCQEKTSQNNITVIELEQIVGRGHFASVFKGKYEGSVVAVKVYPAGWKNKFTSEKDIYELPLMRHGGIIHFLGTGRSPQESGWYIVLQFAENGSLHSFLCENTLSWMQSLKLCRSLSQGLSYLHSDLLSHGSGVHKPPVAHRDLSSSNVVVKADGSCALCDFGCSAILRSCSSSTDHAKINEGCAQLGTLHYMPPEILEGCVNLGNSAFLLQGDIYALSLILWEIWMRCFDLFKDAAVPQHLLPYEQELERNVTLEKLILFVCEMDKRPSIPEDWELLPQASSMKELLTDCWDRDTDARLTASCVMDRIFSLSGPSLP